MQEGMTGQEQALCRRLAALGYRVVRQAGAFRITREDGYRLVTPNLASTAPVLLAAARDARR